MVISFRKTIEKDKVIVPLTNAEDGDGQSSSACDVPVGSSSKDQSHQCHQPRHRPKYCKR